MSPGTQVLMVLVFMVSALYLVGPLLFVLFATFTNVTFPEGEEALLNPYLIYSSAAFGFIAILIMPVFVFLRISNQKFKKVFKTRKFNFKYLVLSLLGLTVLIFTADYLYLFNKWLIEFIPNNTFAEAEAVLNEKYSTIFSPANKRYYPIALIVFGVMPAIAEELVFRGLIMRNLVKSSNNVHFGVIVSSLLFAAFHVQAWNILPMTALAILFGYTYHLTKDIRFPILMHFVYNAIQISLMFYMPEVMA